MPIILPQRPVVSEGDTELVAIDYGLILDSGETLTGTPTVVEVDTTDLTLANKSVNAAQMTIRGTTVPIGEAVLFSMTGQDSGEEYRIRITVSTTGGTVARTFVRDVLIRAD